METPTEKQIVDHQQKVGEIIERLGTRTSAVGTSGMEKIRTRPNKTYSVNVNIIHRNG